MKLPKSQDSWGWKGPLETMQSTPPANTDQALHTYFALKAPLGAQVTNSLPVAVIYPKCPLGNEDPHRNDLVTGPPHVALVFLLSPGIQVFAKFRSLTPNCAFCPFLHTSKQA